MKIQIDTQNKIVKVEDSVKLQELFTFLKRILEDDFATYKLEANTKIINWSNSVYVPYNTNPFWYKQIHATNFNAVKNNIASNNVLNYEVK